MDVVAEGFSIEGDHWVLTVDGDARDLTTELSVTTAAGKRLWGLGSQGPGRPTAGHLELTSGSNDFGPTMLIVRASPLVRAIVVVLSDGTREDLTLHGDVTRLGGRLAVLVHPRRLDVHRIDAISADGSNLNDA
ncbi:hypothetical protein [Nakamurella leprariae]|uniref:Uncharacterized protein n=1 Tax=Nakamurella leprariae TaxID=2803911 RepID=A0A939BY54_9ACTN|nr:hypothetical protein [Nakamurella leprariae]MBM9466256.1 hypothetical protein [Nakamurella leprariae]